MPSFYSLHLFQYIDIDTRNLSYPSIRKAQLTETLFTDVHVHSPADRLYFVQYVAILFIPHLCKRVSNADALEASHCLTKATTGIKERIPVSILLLFLMHAT